MGIGKDLFERVSRITCPAEREEAIKEMAELKKLLQERGKTLETDFGGAKSKEEWMAVGRGYRPVKTLLGHTSSVYLVGFGHGNRFFVTGGEDGSLKMWCSHTGRLLRCFLGHTKGLTDFTLSPDETRLITCSFDRKMLVWDVASGRIVDRLEDTLPPVSAGYHPLFSERFPFILYAAEDGVVVLLRWNFKLDIFSDEKNIFPCKTASKDRVFSASFSYGGVRFIVCGSDGVFRIFKTPSLSEFSSKYIFQQKEAEKTKKAAICLPAQEPELVSLEEHLGSIVCHSFGPEGEFFVSGATDGTARRWWYDKARRGWATSEFRVYGEHEEYKALSGMLCRKGPAQRPFVDSVVISCDGKYLFSTLSNSPRIYIWNFLTGKLVGKPKLCSSAVHVLERHPIFPQLFLSCYADGSVLISSIDGNILFWASISEKPMDGRFSSDGMFFVVGDELGQAHLYSFGSSAEYAQTPVQQFFDFEREDGATDIAAINERFPGAMLCPSISGIEKEKSEREKTMLAILKEERRPSDKVFYAYKKEISVLIEEMKGPTFKSDAVSDEKRLKERRRKAFPFEIAEERDTSQNGVQLSSEGEETASDLSTSVSVVVRRSSRLQSQGVGSVSQLEEEIERPRRRIRTRTQDVGAEEEPWEEESPYVYSEESITESAGESVTESTSDGEIAEKAYPDWIQAVFPEDFYFPQPCDVVVFISEGYRDFILEEKRRLYKIERCPEGTSFGVVERVSFFDGPPLSYCLDIILVEEREAEALFGRMLALENLQFPAEKRRRISVSAYPIGEGDEFVFLYEKYRKKMVGPWQLGDIVTVMGEDGLFRITALNMRQMANFPWKSITVQSKQISLKVSPWQLRRGRRIPKRVPREQRFVSLGHRIGLLAEKNRFNAFIEPVDLANYPEYIDFVCAPVSLRIILQRIRNGFYRSISSIESDVDLLLENVLLFNEELSSICLVGRELHALLHEIINEEKQGLDSRENIFENGD
eukprot:GHVN01007505.1.p1 GENE.GHVN01007505.1~~GHVN01007505.1.p1  ORF type:complete len:987 (-),score=80.81 GHVN01007505.1:942-3902(-)